MHGGYEGALLIRESSLCIVCKHLCTEKILLWLNCYGEALLRGRIKRIKSSKRCRQKEETVL